MTDIDFEALAVPGVAGLHPYLPGKPLSELEREFGISNAVKLASNENPLGPSPTVADALSAEFADLARYPDGNGFALKAALSDQLGVDTDAITLGNGSNDVLDLIARTFAGPGRSVVCSQFAFIVYPIATRAAGAELKVAPAKDYGHDLAAMRELIDETTSLVFIANPNNPTGNWLRTAELEAFISDLPPRVMVVVDEAYLEYVEEDDYPDTLGWIERFPNLIVTRTFSKIHALAALRIGYAVSNPMVANLLNRVRHPFNVNSLAQAAALAALGDKGHVSRSREVNREGLAFLSQLCRDMGLDFIPSVGNFLTIDVTRPAGEVDQALLRQGVIARPVANYGMPNHLRVTVGLADENKRFAEALKAVL